MAQPVKYDLEERTACFAEETISLLRSLKPDAINRRVIEQLVGCSGSIGANYCEATEAESKKDFTHKIGVCRKESKETQHWLRLLAKIHPEHKDRIKVLWKEAHEFVLIFSKIVHSARMEN